MVRPSTASRSSGSGQRAVGEIAGLAEIRAVLQLDSQIGLDDRRVLLHLLRPALGDQTPVVEHVDLLGDAHDQFDVVLDEKHGDPGGADVADPLDQIGALGGVHAGRRLVEQQQARLGGQSAGDLHQTLRPVGKAGGGQVGLVCQPHRGQGLHGPLPGGLLFAALVGKTQTAGPQSRALVPVAADENVLEHGHVHVDAQVLEGAGHAQAGGVGRRQLGDVLAGEPDGARRSASADG